MKRAKVVKRLVNLSCTLDMVAQINREEGFHDVASGFEEAAGMVYREALKIRDGL